MFQFDSTLCKGIKLAPTQKRKSAKCVKIFLKWKKFRSVRALDSNFCYEVLIRLLMK